MNPELFPKFGVAGGDFVHPATMVSILFLAAMILGVRRNYVIVPVLVAIFLIPMDQVVTVASFHFQMMRVVILVAWIRILAMKFSSGLEFYRGEMNAIDKAVVLYAGTSAVTFTLLWSEWGAVILQMGFLYNVCGIYFALRFFIRDEEDVERAIRTLGYIAAIIAVIMLFEQIMGWNPYTIIGGAGQAFRSELMVRGGKIRAMGSFMHPILAGTFGATLLSLFVGLWWKQGRIWGIPLGGMIASGVIMITSVSSTALLACVAGIIALCFWPLRNQMRPIRWGIVITLISLHFVMKAPVWALINRTDLIAGSSGDHRYYLLDQFIRRFEEWWLLGIKSSADWGWGMWDLANQYVKIGLDAGISPLIFFLASIVFGFKYLGIARKDSKGNKKQQLFFWALGSALFAHVVGFFGISYFDQSMVAWYALLAMISAVAGPLQTKYESVCRADHQTPIH